MSGFGTVTKREKESVIELLVGLLRHRSGKKTVFSNSSLRSVLNEFGYGVTDADIRRYIFYIRNNDILTLLIANQHGYYLASDTTDVKEWIDRQEGKILAMQETLASIKKQYKESYKGLIDGEDSALTGGQLDIFESVE